MIGTEGLVQYYELDHRIIKLDYLELAKQLYYSNRTFDLFEYLLNGHSLTVRYLLDNKLFFMYIDNSKPFYYKDVEFTNLSHVINDEHELIQEQTCIVVEKEFKDKVKRKWIEYPTYEETTPDRMVASVYNMFTVFEYEKVKGSTTTKPSYERAAHLIKEIVEDYRNSNKTKPDLEEMRATQKNIEKYKY